MKSYKAMLIMILLSCNIAFGIQSNYTQYKADYGYDFNLGYFNSNLQSYALYVPAGVKHKGVLSQSISSESAIVGQNVSVIFDNDFIYNSKLIIPKGSVISGSIASYQKAGYPNKDAKMMIRFTTVITPYGNMIPINAVIANADSMGMLVGNIETQKENNGEVKISDKIKNSSKKKHTKGKIISIPANTEIELRFVQPITFTSQ